MGSTGVKLVKKVSIEFMNTVSAEAQLFSFECLLIQLYSKALKTFHYFTKTTTNNYTVYKVSELRKIPYGV